MGGSHNDRTAAPLTDRGDRPMPVSQATYRRRRLAVAVAVGASVSALAAGAHGVLTGPGGVPASAAGAGMASARLVVRAEPGDSLWSIAEAYRGEVGLQRYVDALIDLNGGTQIAAGQLVRLP
jgi:LysM domain